MPQNWLPQKEFFRDNFSETIFKPKELWKTLKSLGMPNKLSLI